MSPIRRYLRITKYSVLEVRIYLEKPSDQSWLLSSRDPILARIIEEVRPLVLPKLREENENAKKKSSKKQRGIKDVVDREDFEVTIFLTELSTRHSLLTKQKRFSDKPQLKSTSNKLTGWLNNSDNPIHVEDDEHPPPILVEDDEHPPPILQEEEDVVELSKIPEALKRQRGIVEKDDDEPLFVSSDDEEFFVTQRERTIKRQKRKTRGAEFVQEEPQQPQDDKKKLVMDTSYDGFSIYGRILCLLVKRKGTKTQINQGAIGGSQMMEQWVSTQAAQENGLNDDDDT